MLKNQSLGTGLARGHFQGTVQSKTATNFININHTPNITEQEKGINFELSKWNKVGWVTTGTHGHKAQNVKTLMTNSTKRKITIINKVSGFKDWFSSPVITNTVNRTG